MAYERCPSCFGTDEDYRRGGYICSNPWHADDHLRAKTLARRTTTPVLPRSEGQGTECGGGLHISTDAVNPAALTERLIQAAVDYESGRCSQRELSDARAAVETAIISSGKEAT